MDIETFWDAINGQGNWRLHGDGQLEAEHDLKTAAMLSLFTWRRANPDDVLPDPNSQPMGCWMDVLRGRPLGSRLWLLRREKQTAEVVARAKEYAEESLRWLVDDGVCASIEVTTGIVLMGVLGMHVVFIRPSGQVVKFQFEFAWANLQLIKG